MIRIAFSEALLSGGIFGWFRNKKNAHPVFDLTFDERLLFFMEFTSVHSRQVVQPLVHLFNLWRWQLIIFGCKVLFQLNGLTEQFFHLRSPIAIETFFEVGQFTQQMRHTELMPSCRGFQLRWPTITHKEGVYESAGKVLHQPRPCVLCLQRLQ